jgi:hypothetical protein
LAAVEFTINHIASVFLPALGDYLWMINYRIPFLMGAGLGIVPLVLAQSIRIPFRRGTPEQQEVGAN